MRSSLIFGFLLLATIGCRPSVDSEELGDVIYELPKVPGAEEPYELPHLDEEKEPEPAPESRPDAPDSVSPPETTPPTQEGSSPEPSE